MSANPKDTLFDLCGGHPALNLVNSLDNRFRHDGPNEMLASYGDLLRFLQESGLLSRQHARVLSKTVPPEAGSRALQSVRELREAAAAVLYRSLEGKPPEPEDIRVLERQFMSANGRRELQWEGPQIPDEGTAGDNPPNRAGLVWQWGHHENDPDLPVWILALSVLDILLSPDMARVHTCAVDTCRWLFLDTSKNHKRRWCNMKVCGNRMKARRFQARRDQI